MTTISGSAKITRNQKTARKRSSERARRLIRAYVKRYGSQRRAAKELRITQAQLSGMLSGRLKDTPAMQAALDRADTRAKRAWLMNGDACTVIDAPATLRAASRALQQAQAMIEALVRMSER